MDSPQPPANDPRRDRPSEPVEGCADNVIVEWLEEPPGLDGDRASMERGPLSHIDTLELSSPPGFSPDEPRRRRRRLLPLVLFGLTCISTFVTGLFLWNPVPVLLAALGSQQLDLRRAVIAHWPDGMAYMAAVLTILLAHEMGHFVAAVIHRIPASFPYFLPFPLSPLGTMGAVIGMEGSRANRKEIFDIGLAGPIAGLLVTIPMFALGLSQLDLSQDQSGYFRLDVPLAGRWLMQYLNTPGYEPGQLLYHAQLNPLLMAGWAGFTVTGLNMFPVSQLDGGHVIYTLFGRKSHWIARAFILFAISYMVITSSFGLVLMIALILFIGTDHPPTRDDSVPLGWFRTVLGWVCLSIPVLCFPPRLIV